MFLEALRRWWERRGYPRRPTGMPGFYFRTIYEAKREAYERAGWSELAAHNQAVEDIRKCAERVG